MIASREYETCLSYMGESIMKTMLRLYHEDDTNYHSTFFDLLHGDTETKQTKGLLYLI